MSTSMGKILIAVQPKSRDMCVKTSIIHTLDGFLTLGNYYLRRVSWKERETPLIVCFMLVYELHEMFAKKNINFLIKVQFGF